MNDRPNILLISADQMRRDALGAYSNRVIKTPNIDKLADNGIAFDNHFLQNPVCMPSRWTIFTGRYPRNHGVRDNGVEFDNNEQTIARVLRDSGYATGAFGKMHLTPALLTVNDDIEQWPEDRFGFTSWAITDDAKKGAYLEYLKEKDEEIYRYVKRQGEEKVEEDLMSAAERSFDVAPQIKENSIPPELHQSSWIADKTIDFIKQEDKPFFAWCSFVDPHHPFDPPEPYASMYDPEKIPAPLFNEDEMLEKPKHFYEMHTGYSPGNEKYDFRTVTEEGWKVLRAKYYGMVSLIDYNIGRIVDALRESGKLDTTVIIVTSDHGELLGDHGLLFKGPFHYDCLIRVPLIVSAPQYIPSGSRVRDITQHTDLFPTICSFAGVQAPNAVQGRSLGPLLNGDYGNGYEYALTEHYCGDWGFNVKTIRSRNWRLTYYGSQTFGELYDLDNDPNEFKNLWDHPGYRSKREELKTALLDHLLATEDRTQKRVAKY
jgi:arylsulfatase